MQRVRVFTAAMAALTILVAGCGSATKLVTEGLAPTTTLPAPTTTTTTTVPACPAPAVASGSVVTELATPNTANLAYSATPGGPTVGHLKNTWGGPSTTPVIDQQNGWVQVRLNSRPNGSTAWLPSQSVAVSTTPYRIVISICQRSLTLFRGPDPVYTGPVGVGRPQWPTPTGPSFVFSIVATPRSQQYIYGPTVFIMATHSNVFTEFDGGDGTVAIHGYPSDPASTRGVASSHGCVRASSDTINTLKAVPVGTPIDVVA